jgi:hypothetical protein
MAMHVTLQITSMITILSSTSRILSQTKSDYSFCGDWAGAEYSSDGCPGTCTGEVANDPNAFEYSYWGVSSLKVYQATTPV